MPYKGQGVTVQCSTANQAVCPAGYYCHFGADTQTTVCCQALGIFEGKNLLDFLIYKAKRRKFAVIFCVLKFGILKNRKNLFILIFVMCITFHTLRFLLTFYNLAVFL
jgi:hypothetical protein